LPENEMVYLKKNVPLWERTFRVLSGLAMIACGLVGLHAGPLGIGLAVAGAVPILTGFVGYCPMCAVGGRRPVDANPSR
jgi:hypothetical protein